MLLDFAYCLYLLSGKKIWLVNLFFRIVRSEYKVVGKNHIYTSRDHAYTTFEFEDMYGDCEEEVTEQDYFDYVLDEIQMQNDVNILLDNGLEHLKVDGEYEFYSRFLYILTNLHDFITDSKYIELIEACVDRIMASELEEDLKRELSVKYLSYESEVLNSSPLDVLKSREY